MRTGPANLFVYGSLRRGGGVFERFLGATATHVYPATLDGHALYGIGLPYPVMAPCPGAVVHGEIVCIDAERVDEVVGSLDYYEGREYRRVIVRPVTDSGKTMAAWSFVSVDPDLLKPSDLIEGGDWLAARRRT